MMGYRWGRSTPLPPGCGQTDTCEQYLPIALRIRVVMTHFYFSDADSGYFEQRFRTGTYRHRSQYWNLHISCGQDEQKGNMIIR